MLLSEIIQAVQPIEVIGIDSVEVKSLINHSAQVSPGALFVCIPGYKYDGHHYFQDAVDKGALAIITEKKLDTPITQVIVSNSRKSQALASQKFFDFPSNKLKLVGVTGTNGKTTISYLAQNILQEAGYNTGLIGTINYKYDNVVLPPKHTTPDAPELGHILHKMVENKVDAVVMEVSSHALELDRVTGCDFDVVVFSNISRDHFEFHKNFESYLRVKARLFANQCQWGSTPPEKRYAVVNIDDVHSSYFLKVCETSNIFTFGFGENANVRAINYHLEKKKSSFELKVNDKLMQINLPIPGLFNIYNALAAIAIGLCFNIDLEVISKALAFFKGVPGRYEFIDCGQDFDVIVDFAHNPKALLNILSLKRSNNSAKKIVVFGCEGGKDRGKRSLMGSIAAHHANYSIITSDNIYAEKPVDIARDIEKGLLKEGKNSSQYEIIVNRFKAIERALEIARPGDMVIVAGKGHESRKIIYNQVIPFDDREVVRGILQGDKISLPLKK